MDLKEQLPCIGFENLKIQCIIGVYPEERQEPQEILVDLYIKAHCIVANDQIQDTVSYAYLAELCSQLAQEGKYRLLETYAAEALNKIVALEKVEWAKIRIKKPKAIRDAQHALVEMERCKTGH
jgi:dihydroneopterin aldolase